MGAAAAVVDGDGRILLVRHTYGRLNWELPGGASEPRETIVETALRELREEAGIVATPERLTGLYYDSEEDAHHAVVRCRVAFEAVPKPSSSEISACDYWPADALPRPISDFTIRRIDDALGDTVSPLLVTIPPRTWLE
jgi:8-oxo-dGTP pyrophosphatase MutT (NUDIX family)